MLAYDILAPSLPGDLLPPLRTVCAAHGLSIIASGALKTLPGSRHWHLRRAGKPGVLEVTLWPKAGRAWVSVHENRDGGWAKSACPRIARALAAQVGG